jgi:hypothetical protein
MTDDFAGTLQERLEEVKRPTAKRKGNVILL